MIYRALAAGAIVGPAVLTVASLVLEFLSPGYTLWGIHVAPYSPISQPISGLGLGPTGPYMNAAFIVNGLLIIAGVVGVVQLIPELSGRARWTAIILLGLPGVGSVIDGLFTFESGLLHFVGFLMALTTMVSLPVVGLIVRRVPSWHRLGNWLVVSGPITFVLALVFFLTFTPSVEGLRTGVAGLTERILVVEMLAWYVLLGWHALRSAVHKPTLAFS